MNNSREKFEEALNNCILETQCLLEYDEFTTRDIAHFIWQAATEQSRKEIAEKDAMIAEYDRLMSIDDTRIVLLQHNIVELKAREKVLVDAISSSLNCIREEINLNNYTETLLGDFISDYGDMVIILQYALANVRGEL